MVMIPDARISDLQMWLTDCCTAMRRSIGNIHMTGLSGDNKYYIASTLAQLELPVSTISVKMDKVNSQRLQRRGWAYRFYGKEMVRVATHYAASIDELATLRFEQHGYLEGFDRYVRVKLRSSSYYMDRFDEHRIKYDHLGRIELKAKDEEPLLSAADCVSHACDLAFNEHRQWGMSNPTYLDLVAPCLWSGPSDILGGRWFGAILEPRGVASQTVLAGLPSAYRRFW